MLTWSFSSTESGIIDDISTSPDEANEPLWEMQELSINSKDTEEDLHKSDHQQEMANKSPGGSNPYINESLAVHL